MTAQTDQERQLRELIDYYAKVGRQVLTVVKQAVETAAAAVRAWWSSMSPETRLVLAPHPIRPDFDLRCLHPGCGLGPEDH